MPSEQSWVSESAVQQCNYSSSKVLSPGPVSKSSRKDNQGVTVLSYTSREDTTGPTPQAARMNPGDPSSTPTYGPTGTNKPPQGSRSSGAWEYAAGRSRAHWRKRGRGFWMDGQQGAVAGCLSCPLPRGEQRLAPACCPTVHPDTHPLAESRLSQARAAAAGALLQQPPPHFPFRPLRLSSPPLATALKGMTSPKSNYFPGIHRQAP